MHHSESMTGTGAGAAAGTATMEATAMSISEFCVRDVVCTTRTATISKAAALMRQYHVGDVVVVDEATVLEANEIGRTSTGIDADHTGTAGLAGLLALTRSGAVRPDETVAVLFTGAGRRGGDPEGTAADPDATMRPVERRAP